MAPALRSWFLLTLAVTACEFPRPPDVADDAAGSPSDAAGADAALADAAIADAPPDAPDVAGTVLHVSTTGDDANDGLTQPVKTLKHAIGLAAANPLLVKIVVATGRYSSASGETFPYTVPTNLVIVGPAGGGAIFAGTKSEPGLTVGTGTLQDVELEDFTVAITATGTARVANTRIRTSMVGIRGETTAKLTVDNLDITGAVGACASGIVLTGAAGLTATMLATRGLAAAIDARDQSTVTVANANITGVLGCRDSVGNLQSAITGNTTKPFVLTDSLLDGGETGLFLAAAPTVVSNTIIRNMRGDAIGGGSGGLQMTGGELSGCNAGAEGGVASDSYTNVVFNNNGISIYWYGTGSHKLVMRGCNVRATGAGSSAISLWMENSSAADFGTLASPGNNIFQANDGINLLIVGGTAAPIDAVGNTWKPVQGANSQGRYPAGTTIHGPVNNVQGNNFAIGEGGALNL